MMIQAWAGQPEYIEGKQYLTLHRLHSANFSIYMTLILAKKSTENEDSILNKYKQASNPTATGKKKKNIFVLKTALCKRK